MAHKIFNKINDSWKVVSKGWVQDSSGNWVKIKKGWVKVDSVTGWKLFFASGLPKGIILPFNSSSSIPNGWERFNSADGRLIIGADVDYPVNTIGGEQSIIYTGEISYSGSHSGTTYSWSATFELINDCSYCVKYDENTNGGYTAGGHTHTSITSEVEIAPKCNKLRLIKLVDDSRGLSPKIGVFSVTNLQLNEDIQGTDFNEISTDGIYRSELTFDNTTTTQEHYLGCGDIPNDISGSFHNLSEPLTTNFAGDHHHGGIDRTLKVYSTGKYAIFAGGHTHTAYIQSYTNNYNYCYLSMWESATETIEASQNMIGMWEGIYPPEGWAICNGQNGTPDLRSKFIRFADGPNNRGLSGGEMKAKFGTYTDIGGAHTHIPTDTNSSGSAATLDIKHAESISHTHIGMYIDKQLIPEYYALSFIMKLAD